MTLIIYNTLSRKKEEFVPLVPGRVHLYVCGPTVYDHAHLGHAKTYVSFDLIVRYLRYRGYTVRYVRSYFADMAALGVLPPDISPRASAHIPEQIEMIKTLLANGHAYEVNGSVYFDVRSYPAYGKLS